MDKHPESLEFREILAAESLAPSVVDLIVRFRELVIDENERQNLTRLLSPKDFFEGHYLDARELLASEFVDYPAMDLGSGVGVPGVIAAILTEKSWVLCESEKKKAEFLSRAVEALGLDSQVTVFSGRGEDFLKTGKISSIVARAVGPVGRIYQWLRPCSTWNNLVLLKGKGWTAEYSEFCENSFSKELNLLPNPHSYVVGAENKERLIVKLERHKR